MNNIKDKVDAIAAKLFHRRRDSGFSEDGEDLWQQFRYELEKEGFSKDVLFKNKVSEARLSSVYPEPAIGNESNLLDIRHLTG